MLFCIGWDLELFMETNQAYHDQNPCYDIPEPIRKLPITA